MTDSNDTRGQAGVIGFILLFAVLVGLLAFNQAFVVPQENEEVEFQHSQDARDDVVDLRDASLAARASGDHQAATVRLGESYPTRFLALNPPDPAGTLRTTEADENITVEDATFDIEEDTCGVDDGVDTVFLNYEANYNEFQSSLPVVVENTVTHRRGPEEGPVLDTDQQLIDDNRIWIVRLTGDYRARGSGTEGVDVFPSETGRNITDEGFNLTVPTELGEAEWEQLLSDEMVSEGGYVEDVVGGDDNVTIVMDDPGDTSHVVRCTTVGIDEQPDVSPTQEPFSDSNTSTAINPTGPGTVELIKVDKDSGETELTFQNNFQAPRTAVEVRIPFGSGPGGSEGDSINVAGTDVVVGAPPRGLEEPVDWSAGPGTNRTVVADVGQNTEFALELRFVDPETGDENRFLYFVGDEFESESG